MDQGQTRSSQTLQASASLAQDLDFSTWPPIFVSATFFDTNDLHELEQRLTNAGAKLTYDINEAEIVLSKVTKKRRVQLDLRTKGLWTEEVASDLPVNFDIAVGSVRSSPKTGKKRKHDEIKSSRKQKDDIIVIDDSSTESEEDGSRQKTTDLRQGSLPAPKKERIVPRSKPLPKPQPVARIVRVAKIEWFNDSEREGRAKPLQDYLTFTGEIVKRQSPAEIQDDILVKSVIPSSPTLTSSQPTPSYANILARAKQDQDEAPNRQAKVDRFGRRKYGQSTPSADPARWEAGHGTNSKYAHLLHATTTEHDCGISSDLPEMPEWVKKGVKYACRRLTPKTNPNDVFISLLKKIKLGRLLTNDEIGVRAYSTSIASLAAYPYKISNPREILALPGCDHKIANLYVEWANTGKIQAVEDLEADEDLQVLRSFYDIWGVGAITAREFYYDKGWRELADIIELGWDSLSRVQQIGVKYYNEFQDLIPRAEVESICEVIHRHAVKVRDEGIQSIIVGGYRRGKEASGDVDIILSHPDESFTADLVEDIVASLEQEDWITHTLLLSLNNTKRGQQTLPYRTGGGGHGFDSLDKALVVWQDPAWPTKDRDLQENPHAKNPNIHRRVDIIISPWRTVGCAVVGWSGGTTFERDLRRLAKNVKSWKFDSSGVRDRRNGEVVDLEGYFAWNGKEGPDGRAKTMEEAERRVFEGFGIEYIEPEERCTG